MVFSTLFSFSLNLAIRSSRSEPQSATGLVFANCIELLHMTAKNIINLISVSINSEIRFWHWKCCTQYASKFENSAVATGLEKVSFIPIPKKGNDKECLNYCTIALISHTSKVMLKIFQARLQQYLNHELPDIQACFRKGRGTRDQIANICWIIKKARELHKIIYFCFIDYAKAFDCMYHNKMWRILKEMRIPEHLTCLLRNVYAG